MSYPFREIEEKWQDIWEKKNTFKTDIGSKKPKYYCLDMFPYPSGAGLHVGHPEGYTATDIISRFKRMKGFEVLHPMGWDAFGLPAERYAMTHGIHPRITTEQNVNNFRRQIKSLGLSYDWSREISTTDPSYYRHTQWIFLKIYNSYFDHREKKAKPISGLIQEFEQSGSSLFFTEQSGTDAHKFTAEEWKAKSPVDKEKILSGQRLVYSAEIPVNWCEELGTVLANEEVEEWTAKGYSVVRKPMRQYMMRITAYAERLLEDLSLVSWPQSTLEMQKNWIGRSEGCEIEFRTESNDPIPVFTTRPDTIFGVTYLVLAPEHPLVKKITSQGQSAEVESYAKAASLKSDLDRTELNKEKTGVFTGSYALHPFTGEKIPVWISDYVLYHYGTGAIMAVPAHDERDFSFAKIMKLPIRHVIAGADSEEVCFDSKESKCINSKSDLLDINGLSYKEAFDKTASVLEKKGIGRKRLQYKLRDWLFARQRYWGEPIPLVHSSEGLTFDIPESELPLTLPDLEDYKPDKSGESALAKATSWLKYESSGKTGRRETNTMPQWAGSCWYYLRFIDPVSRSIFCKSELEQKWMPVDLYVGGAEHAVLHLLYSRFWHKILFDLGYVSTPEPFKKLVHQGLILGEDKRKMSKSLGNVVNPDDVIKEFGADSFRLFEMFMGPLEMSKPWNTRGVEGVFRFLNRTWRLFHKEDGTFFTDDTEPDKEELKILNRTIQKVEVDIENLSFNTAISQMMIFVNEMTPKPNRPWKILRPFVLLLAPFAPHLAEEIWSKFGYKNSLAHERFPYVDTAYLEDDTMVIVVQVNGKLRDQIEVSKTMEQSEIISLAKKAEKIPQYIEGKKMIKEIYVKEKLVNFV
ncbi:MAG TPA: leucine--tRNA ligase, partial [Leptospiraceae bacterium]|nr:leucine--tRNA ligase [Leptospiraceae bacterium]